MGTLYVVGTPLGNLEDLSARARRVLAGVALIVAEDTRRTRKLLAHAGIDAPLASFHAHSTPAQRARLVARLAAADVALVTDAGTPGVSDPGPELVADAVAAGHAVVPIPGPSAVATALSVSGLPADRYVFIGFLPRRSQDRRACIAEVAAEPHTVVAFETPQRLAAALADLAAGLGADRRACVGRELTKLHEEVWHGTLGAAAARWASIAPRGEITLVIAGAPPAAAEAWDDQRVAAELARLRGAGVGAREASR
ncbi:16S rRNA (cytidine(1402)-2'-O)-methyltransferase, partial [bacterium]